LADRSHSLVADQAEPKPRWPEAMAEDLT